MLKFLLIVFLIAYVVYKVGGFIFRTILLSTYQAQHKKQANTQQQQYKTNGNGRYASDGNVRIDYAPGEQTNKGKKKNFDGGEYVDFEEVK